MQALETWPITLQSLQLDREIEDYSYSEGKLILGFDTWLKAYTMHVYTFFGVSGSRVEFSHDCTMMVGIIGEA